MNCKIYLKRFQNQFQNIMGVGCLTAMLLFLYNMGNEMYDTLKNIQAAKALFMFALFMLITQKIKFFNWQTLVVSLLYLPVAYQYRTTNILLPDIFHRDRIVIWIVWFVLLIIVDMLICQKVNPLSKLNTKFLLIYGIMSVSMIFYRNGRTQPIIFILFFLFYLIPLEQEQWKKIVNQFCLSWLIMFFIILYRSLKNNPQVDPVVGRWYGDFLNIGDFGLFMACVVTIVIFKLYESRSKRLFYVLCLLPIIWTVFRVSTITMFIGILFLFLMSYILLFGRQTIGHVLLRLLIVTFSIVFIACAGFFTLYLLSNTDKDYWNQVLLEGNTFFKPIANLIRRAHYMFDKARTFADSNVFVPGTLMNYIDLFASGRLSVIVSFARHFNFTGNLSMGLQVGEYFAYNAHNCYVQMIYEYGYIGGGSFILWLLYSTVFSVKQYLQQHQTTQILLCFWLSMTLGVFLGERVNLYAPILVSSLFLTYPLMVNHHSFTR